MDEGNSEFIIRLRQTFRVEAEEHISTITAGLIELEQKPALERSAEIIEALFREVHSLKGASRSVNIREMESVCQPLETVLFRLKQGEINSDSALCDLFHRSMDFLALVVASLEDKRTMAERALQKELIKQLENFTSTDSNSLKPVTAVPVTVEDCQTRVLPKIDDEYRFGQTIRIPVFKLDSLLLQAEELIQTKMGTRQLAGELREIKSTIASRQTGGTTEDLARWCDLHLDTLHTNISAASRKAEKGFRALQRIVDIHLETMKQVLMMPASSLTEIFPRIIRDLSRQQGKEILLTITGADIEIDKRVLEELKDPLIHLIRNCIDHGIEKPEERTDRNKARIGNITVAFSTREGRQLGISISDDGAGIDVEKVRKKAIKSGLIKPEAAELLDANDALALIFQSGFTTSPMITEISGRGLGLAIVREKVEKLGGTVTVETSPQIKTTFKLLLPITLTTFRGVVVQAGGKLFVIPTANVERALRVKSEEIKTIENCETISLNGKILSLVQLSETLGLAKQSRSSTSHHIVVVLAAGKTHIGFEVDEVIDELQVLVKSMGKQLSRVRNISGATILGNGKLIPVLNVQDLMKSALQSRTVMKGSETDDKPDAALRILVAEDSITSRTMIKTILETAGFVVTTAVDGSEAFAEFCIGEFDLVVSDVDMPRMSGFELTAKIRSSSKNSDLPVVLVTALESSEDRERGIDVGANAYIVKNSFDQSNFLEVINKLI